MSTPNMLDNEPTISTINDLMAKYLTGTIRPSEEALLHQLLNDPHAYESYLESASEDKAQLLAKLLYFFSIDRIGLVDKVMERMG